MVGLHGRDNSRTEVRRPDGFGITEDVALNEDGRRVFDVTVCRCDSSVVAKPLGGIVFAVALVMFCGSGGAAVPRIVISAAQWPRADVLFHRDPRWLGSDGAYSVPLGAGRVLWLFGDTLVARTRAHVRSQAAFVRNTIALERGTDPRTASMRFFWRDTAAGPGSYFREQGSRWFWPQHGIQLGRTLALFLERVERNPNGTPGFDFQGAGWRLALVANPSATPARWRVRFIAPPATFERYAAGRAVNVVDGWVVSLAIPQHGSSAGYLIRWRPVDLARGRLQRAQWWAGSRGWVATSHPSSSATPVIANAGSECSLSYDHRLHRWLLVRSEGFGATTIVASFATTIEGPWSRPRFVYRPPESNRPNTYVYAAKAHPELTGGGLAITYATNAATANPLRTLIREPTLYYPRFVRATISH